MHRMCLPQQLRCGPCTASSHPSTSSKACCPRPAPSHHPRGPRHVATRVKPNETPEEAQERRLRESQRVDERVIDVADEQELNEQLAAAGDKLVLLEISSESVCETGENEVAEMHWKLDERRRSEENMQRCRQVKHVLQRIARESSDCLFLTLHADEDSGLCAKLGVEVLPTLQFYRNGKKLWEHRGVLNMESTMGDGVLYYGDTAANNVKASEYITDVHSSADFSEFLQRQEPSTLVVVMFSLTFCGPCIHVFPAMLALAKNFVGLAAFARVVGDENSDLAGLTTEMGVIEAPTFVFFRGGQEVHRHVGASRADLIGKILEVQAAAGIAPPPPTHNPRRVQRSVGSRRVKA